MTTLLQQRSRCDRIVFLAVLFAFAFCVPSAWGEIIVGRITNVEGQLLRFVPDQNDWVATIKDAPFGIQDALYSDQEGKAEIFMPNNIWVRLGGSTQVQLIATQPDAVELDVSLGVARIFNESAEAIIKVTTPFGYVVAPQNTSFDLYVGDQSTEIIALSGTVDFIHIADNTKYEVVSGGSSVIANTTQVGSGDGTVEADWDAWNQTRNEVWAKRDSETMPSAQYLPESLRNDAYELEENGKWERVTYQGREIEMWRPTAVAADWAPFTSGRWTEWNGDNTWVPDEPFGYTTHHYGYWISIEERWYWQPPPLTEPEPSWYPGRVAWVGSDDEVGWVPLAPEEPYYSHRQWGPAATVITTAGVTVIAVSSLTHWNRAVFVPQNKFYGEKNYAHIRMHDHINKKLNASGYKLSPDFNKIHLGDHATKSDRFAFTNAEVKNKPHQSVNDHIKQNQKVSKQDATQFNAKSVQQTLKHTRTAAPSKQAVVSAPQITNKLVPANQVNKPASEVKFGHHNPKEKPIPVSATTQQAGVTGSQMHRMPGGPAQNPGLTGPRRPHTPETTAPGATNQQHGVTGPHRPPATTDPGSNTQAQQQRQLQQQQQQKDQQQQHLQQQQQQKNQQQQHLQQQQQQKDQQQQHLQQQQQQKDQQNQQLQQQQQQKAQQQQHLQQQQQQKDQQNQQLQQQQQQKAQQQQQLQQQQQQKAQQNQQLQQQQQQKAQQHQHQNNPQEQEALRKLCKQNPQDPRCK